MRAAVYMNNLKLFIFMLEEKVTRKILSMAPGKYYITSNAVLKYPELKKFFN